MERTFCECEFLNSVTALNLKYIGNFAFYNCKSLNSVNMSKVESVLNYAFSKSAIKTADLPKCSYIGNAVFSRCDDLYSVNIPLVTKIMPRNLHIAFHFKK